ncbi:MAG TPA: GvpL/GvpF family gas vesicle protein [Actinomycetales bacterium]|nr:GvpL/GvpF family gas vesicle protein [Actinomycetales bacterium]
MLHLYGVVTDSAMTPQDVSGRLDRPVRYVADDGLRAIVSDIGDDTRVGRADLLAHAHVLEAFAAVTTVVPGQFGMLFPDEETVRKDLLRARHEELAHLIASFEGLVQLTVHVRFQEEPALREVLSRDPDLVGLREAARAPDADQDLQVRLGQAVEQGLEQLKGEEADVLLQRLAPHARAVAVNEARGANDVLNVALLVERGKQRELDAAVSELGEEVASRMTVRYVGPQPPYSFLEPMRSGELSWA